MRIIGALLIVVFAGVGSAFAHGQERVYPPRAGYPPYGFRVFTDWQPSGLRLDIAPDDAQVFVDRQSVGAASQFGGSFKRLALHAGPHLLEIRKTGFVSLVIELNLFPAQRVTLARTMQPSRGNESTGSSADVFAPSFEEGAFLTAAPDGPSGELRFDVSQKDAEIYADGFYVGIVSDFNGSQHMMLTQGPHHLTLRREGYDTLEVNLSIDSERTVMYRAAMTRAAAH